MRFICFETDDGVYHFEVNSPSTWVEVIGEVFAQKSISQSMLKKIIDESSDVILVENALTYFNGNLTFDYLNKLMGKFSEKGEDIYYGIVEYCAINKRRVFLKRYLKSENSELRKAAHNALKFI